LHLKICVFDLGFDSFVINITTTIVVVMFFFIFI